MLEQPAGIFELLSKKLLRHNLLSLMLALQENLDYEDTIKLLLKYDKHGIIFLFIEHPSLNKAVKRQFILEVFKYSLIRE
jgi:hypothetical protein